jgi:pimeloyl-ACP methyl ester carboxylesterase
MLGHSWGADISLFYAINYTRHCKSVVHLCGHGVHNDALWSEECARNAEESKEPERTSMIVGEIEYPMNYDVLDKQLASYWKYLKAPMLYKNIAALQVPVLVICVENDPRPIWKTIQLAHLLPVSKLEILKDCCHWPWVEKPELVSKMIIDWLDNFDNTVIS